MLEKRQIPGRYTLYSFLEKLGLPCKWLYPLLFKSYSKQGEDKVLFDLFSDVHQGTYVDVGGFLPKTDSDTYLLYRLGWRGYIIEADQRHQKIWQKVRPKDVFIQALISDKEETLYFDNTKKSGSSAIGDSGVKMPTKTLTQICKEYQIPQRIDLLKIDIEGLDWQALRGLDFTVCKPDLIMIETHHWLTKDAINDARVQALTNYEVIYHNRRNIIMADQDWLRNKYNTLQDVYESLNPDCYNQ